MSNPILEAAKTIQAAQAKFQQKNFLVGFDGFVDEIIHPVATRSDKSHFERISTIDILAKRIAAAAGKSTNIELVPVMEKVGGNGPLMAMAMAGMGAKVTCVGLMGYPQIQAVFNPLQEVCEVISVGNPGHTDALEFLDGKVMLGKLNTIKDMSWTRLLDVIGEAKISSLLNDSHLVACTNWTMLTEMDEIIQHFTSLIKQGCHTRFFFDLADPEKRPSSDIERVLKQIQLIDEKCGSILGLNLKEAQQIAEVLDIKASYAEEADSVAQAAQEIREKLNIQTVVVHAVKFAGAASRNKKTVSVAGPYCAAPKLTTGAGDHFNGGFASGIMVGLDELTALYAGVGTSGAYVRKASSPSHSEVCSLLEKWGQGKNLD